MTQEPNTNPNPTNAMDSGDLGGYDLDFFKPTQTESASPEPAPQARAPQEAAPQDVQSNQAPAQDDDYSQFNAQLTKYVGFGVDELKSMYQDMMAYRQSQAQQQREQMMSQLRDSWGDRYEDTFNAVQQRFAALPPEKQALLNNVEGALLIAKVLEQERAMSSVPGADVPQLTSNSADGSAVSKFRFTISQIRQMPKNEYTQRNAEITEAFRLGLVDMDN